MRTICLYFQVHQPFRFRTYRFFDIGNDHYYYDDYTNESILRKVAEKSYLPANRLLLEMISRHKGKFKIAFSVSGIAIEQFKLYAPDVLDSFRALAETGQVEFLAETYAHSLASMKDSDEFTKQVMDHKALVKEHFGLEPNVFRNTELIYSDEIGAAVYKMGFRTMLTEGAKHVLGWKSPNYLYCNAIEPRLKVLLKNFKLSDDIAFRFSNKSWSDYPLTAEKFADWLKALPAAEETVNLFMDYETFGEHQWAETGIFEFLKALPEAVFKKTKYTFSTPSEVAKNLQVVSAVHVPNPISWADEERDLSAWLGNEMQKEAFNKLYELKDRVYESNDRELLLDFKYLQVSDHFYYMSTKFFSDGEVHSYFNPYSTPYEAFINYMNVLSDFKIRVDAAVPSGKDGEISRLSKIIREKDETIAKYDKEIQRLKKSASHAKATAGRPRKGPVKTAATMTATAPAGTKANTTTKTTSRTTAKHPAKTTSKSSGKKTGTGRSKK
ncbi:MAG: glycoside hydrolase family 57 protein [Bacteroidales bacterium]|nr:glycoside hydrolase family 57 protein [Bacteroidales bacterium]MDT8430269.1 glycoside hydrolase family 57 protein [Bacteroidales bacterium]